MNDTLRAELRSWVDSANAHDSDFPIQNLPLGVFRAGPAERPRLACAIGEDLLDLHACADEGVLDLSRGELGEALRGSALNGLMALGREAAASLRAQLSLLLREDDAARPRREALRARLLRRQADVELLLPAQVGDYTDFYASIHHATNVGRLFRPEQPLLPNYKWLPIGYHGRASSLVASGTPVRRPHGQRKPPDRPEPSFGPSASLDYELELGAFVGPGNPLGQPVPLAEAERHLFGLCLVNDWSARDIQAWEYQPLGPFLGKSFATSVSPWVVTLDALEPFRSPRAPRPDGDPQPLSQLDSQADRERGGFDVRLQVLLRTPRMREAGLPPATLAESRARDLYWTLAQLLAHHTSNGCNLRPGDLLASGTVSGPDDSALGSLLELTRRGAQPVSLPGGETRGFLQDGDEVVLRGRCERPGFTSIGFGECRGRVVP